MKMIEDIPMSDAGQQAYSQRFRALRSVGITTTKAHLKH